MILFQQSAIPWQNVLLADQEGNIGWTIAGPLPERKGYSGRIPIKSSMLESHAVQWLQLAEYPVILNPPGQRLWSANSRHIGGKLYALLGDGRYTSGMRAQQIRNRLREKTIFTESDLLAVQLDNRADYLDEWRPRLERAMNVASIAPWWNATVSANGLPNGMGTAILTVLVIGSFAHSGSALTNFSCWRFRLEWGYIRTDMPGISAGNWMAL